MDEQKKFLEQFEDKEKVDVLEQPIVPPKEEEKDVDPELVPESMKDRAHKRLQQRLQAEREANIAMATRLETITEANKLKEEPEEYLKAVEKIYGTESPEALAATELLKSALKSVEERAMSRALDQFRSEKQEEAQALSKEEATLDSMLEELEDTYNVDLTSPQAENLRRGFFKKLEKLSPKDQDGNVLYYADHHAVWEDYNSTLKRKTENRAKDLSDRSMINSGAPDTKLEQTTTEKYLLEHGFI